MTLTLLLGTALTAGCLAAVDDEAGDDGVEGIADGEGGDEGDIETNDAALSAGVNGKACLHSPYNCKFRVKGGNRIKSSKTSIDWAIHDGDVVDGNGELLGHSGWDHMKFNYGQTRHIDGVSYAMALSTPSRSAGWFPIDKIKDAHKFRERVGEVNAKDTGGKRLGCYAIKGTVDPKLAYKKVVYDEKSKWGRAADYLPLRRANGRRYANVVFNVPGFGLGGAAVDIYPEGTKFQRVDVPTDTGAPSLSAPLYVKDDVGRYRKPAGSMKFVYGYIDSETGARRFGWMALDALIPSKGCL